MASVISVSVKVLRGKEARFEVAESEVVRAFKQLIAPEFDVPERRQRLVFKGKTLSDSGKLCDYNIKDGMKVHLFVQDDTAAGRTPSTQAQTTSGLAATTVTAAQATASSAAAGSASSSSGVSRSGQAAVSTTLTSSSRHVDVAEEPAAAMGTVADTSPSAWRNTNLWTQLDRVLQPHFRPEDVEKVKKAFFINFQKRMNSLSLQELEEYAKACVAL
ncbi:ubiquilin-2-like [Sycon ciliatum]|uniref:ubiquilin-2-like n=1 Tax=Sycon ciliatum TaxID=27933 RepID=UPI0031F5F3CB